MGDGGTAAAVAGALAVAHGLTAQQHAKCHSYVTPVKVARHQAPRLPAAGGRGTRFSLIAACNLIPIRPLDGSIVLRLLPAFLLGGLSGGKLPIYVWL